MTPVLTETAIRDPGSGTRDPVEPTDTSVNEAKRPDWAGPLLLMVAFAVIHTWPLALAPGTHSRNDNGDAQLNTWILAFSEPLMVPAILGAPIAWLGGSPVLVYNLMVIAGFALSALAAYALALKWTHDRIAS